MRRLRPKRMKSAARASNMAARTRRTIPGTMNKVMVVTGST